MTNPTNGVNDINEISDEEFKILKTIMSIYRDGLVSGMIRSKSDENRKEYQRVIKEVFPKLIQHYQNTQGMGSEARKLLQVADCPQCKDKSGAYYDNAGEVCQCQWCYEVNELFPQKPEVKK